MNASRPDQPSQIWRWFRIITNGLVCLAILAASVIAVIIINRTEPTAQKMDTTRKSAALVETKIVHRGTFSPRLSVLGTVESAQRITLSPRVSGQVTEISDEFVPGGQIQKGELLLRIDPSDFENALAISESQLEKAEASMKIEEARQRLAEKELKLLEGTIEGATRGLVMREPQIASMKADISAAEAAVDRAKLDLERANVYAPFDAQILSRAVNVGSQVRLGDELGQLIGLDEYWVMAAVPVRSLRRIQIPDPKLAATDNPNTSADTPAQTAGSKVILRNIDVWGTGVFREAVVSGMIGTLDQQTRLARILISVKDPLGLTSGEPPLILDTLIETEIEGRPIRDVIRLEREYVRDQDTVWVMKDEKLEIRDVTVVFNDAEFAYIQTGIEDGDEIVTSTLATVAEGIGLRRVNGTNDSEAPTDDNQTSDESTPEAATTGESEAK